MHWPKSIITFCRFLLTLTYRPKSTNTSITTFHFNCRMSYPNCLTLISKFLNLIAVCFRFLLFLSFAMHFALTKCIAHFKRNLIRHLRHALSQCLHTDPYVETLNRFTIELFRIESYK